MADWATFEAEAPALAAVAAELWPGITALHRGARPPAGRQTFDVGQAGTHAARSRWVAGQNRG